MEEKEQRKKDNNTANNDIEDRAEKERHIITMTRDVNVGKNKSYNKKIQYIVYILYILTSLLGRLAGPINV